MAVNAPPVGWKSIAPSAIVWSPTNSASSLRAQRSNPSLLQKSQNLSRIIISTILLAIFIFATASASSPPQKQKPYIYYFDFPNDRDFKQVSIADGPLLYATVDRLTLWIRSKQSKPKKIFTAKAGEMIGNVISNANGSVLFGYVFDVTPPKNRHNQPPHSSTLFRWSASTGLTFFPTLSKNQTLELIRVSDDGFKVAFDCRMPNGSSFNAPCYGSPFPSQAEGGFEKTYSLGKGYQNLQIAAPFRANWVIPAGNFKSFLLFQQWPPRFIAVKAKADLHFGLLDQNNIYHEFIPESKYKLPEDAATLYPGLYSRLDYRDLQTNSSNTMLAASGDNGPFVWDISGQLRNPKLPVGCVSFRLTAIDGVGTIYGEASCRDGQVGLRISSAGTQVVRDWLADSGIKGLPANAIIENVSDDGKTVMGFIDPCPCSSMVILSGVKPYVPPPPAPPGSAPLEITPPKPGASFVAYVP